MMQWYDWLIVIVPTVFILGVGVFTRRYLHDVTTFLSASRVCGRYVISVGDIALALSVITLVSYVEVHYKTGFALAFWSTINLPLAVILGLFGYCTYRFRETKAQSIGQFFEMRYSRKFRIFASALRTVSEMLANMIMPALAARFFIYFLGWPNEFELFGITFSTFNMLMLLILLLAVSIIFMGGALSIIVTDTIQGMICYPLMVIFVIFVLVKFSWNDQIMPVMMDRISGESFINPYDMKNMRDFNIFTLFVGIMVIFMHRASWIGGGGSSSAARSPHEQKMAGLLGTWRAAIGNIFYVLVAVAIFTFLHHCDFAEKSHKVRLELTGKIAHEIIADNSQLRDAVISNIQQIPVPRQRIGIDRALSDKENIDSRYLAAGRVAMNDPQFNGNNSGAGNALFQEFRSMYYQLLLPVTLRNMLPSGLQGLFCVLMILLMISTDDSRIFSSAVTISQDVLLPLRKKPLTPRGHMWMIRWVTLAVGLIFFLGSSFMAQLDYIQLYMVLVTTMWLGGCGPVIVLGLYSRFGTTAGAWTSLLTGVFMGAGGTFIQRNWAEMIYPWLECNNWVEAVGNSLEILSKPFNPYVVWEMNPVKCPVNSYEWYFITMVLSLLLYCAVSVITCRKPFNLERMLHRGKYALDERNNFQSAWSWRNLYNKLIGITPEYTLGDKVIAWSYFSYSMIYKFIGAFLVVVIWNLIDPWPLKYWGIYFFIVFLLVPGIMAAITAIWFGICAPIDLMHMFKDLEKHETNPLDDGRVEGNMSLADKAQLEAVDKIDKNTR